MKYIIFLFGLSLIFSGCAVKRELLPAGAQSSEPATEEISGAKINPQGEEKTGLTPGKVPILMFHYVRTVDKKVDPLGYNLSIDPGTFEKQLSWLKENDFRPYSFQDLLSGKEYEKPVILTFDDGYEDFFTTAAPLLQKYGFSASLAIITEKIGQPGYLSEDQIKDLAGKNFEILSHTESHPDLTKISPEKAEEEINGSKIFLENKFGADVPVLVYPSGKYDAETEKMAKDAGYDFALTTKSGIADLEGNILELKRIRIDNRDGMTGFQKKLNVEY